MLTVALAATVGLATSFPGGAQAAGWHHVTGSIRPGLAPGDAGFAVRVLQGDLWEFGYNPGPVTGKFGAATVRALKAFQRDHGLPPSGVLTKATFNAILRTGGWGPPGSGPATKKPAPAPSGSGSGTKTPSPAPSGTGSGTKTSAPAPAPTGGKTITMVATAYGPNAIDNYPYGAVDYFGQPLKPGDVAVDPRVIPLGTRLWVTGYHSPYLPAGGFMAVARDTGGAIKGNRIDIFIDAPRSEVSKFGIQTVKVTILGK